MGTFVECEEGEDATLAAYCYRGGFQWENKGVGTSKGDEGWRGMVKVMGWKGGAWLSKALILSIENAIWYSLRFEARFLGIDNLCGYQSILDNSWVPGVSFAFFLNFKIVRDPGWLGHLFHSCSLVPCNSSSPYHDVFSLFIAFPRLKARQ